MPENNGYKVGDILDPGLVADSSYYTSTDSLGVGGNLDHEPKQSYPNYSVKLNDGSTVIVDNDGTIIAIK